jgi:hypothetical protein
VIVQSLSSSFLRYGATRYHHRAIYLIRSGVVATPRSCARLPEMQQEGKVESAGDNTCGVMGVLRGDQHFYLVFSASSSGAGTTGDNTSASWAWLRGDQHLVSLSSFGIARLGRRRQYLWRHGRGAGGDNTSISSFFSSSSGWTTDFRLVSVVPRRIDLSLSVGVVDVGTWLDVGSTGPINAKRPPRRLSGWCGCSWRTAFIVLLTKCYRLKLRGCTRDCRGFIQVRFETSAASPPESSLMSPLFVFGIEMLIEIQSVTTSLAITQKGTKSGIGAGA